MVSIKNRIASGVLVGALAMSMGVPSLAFAESHNLAPDDESNYATTGATTMTVDIKPAMINVDIPTEYKCGIDEQGEGQVPDNYQIINNTGSFGISVNEVKITPKGDWVFAGSSTGKLNDKTLSFSVAGDKNGNSQRFSKNNSLSSTEVQVHEPSGSVCTLSSATKAQKEGNTNNILNLRITPSADHCFTQALSPEFDVEYTFGMFMDK